jgi:formylglycine-generating enzyme required for sulfatase activity
MVKVPCEPWEPSSHPEKSPNYTTKIVHDMGVDPWIHVMRSLGGCLVVLALAVACAGDDVAHRVRVEGRRSRECRRLPELPWEMCRIPRGEVESGGPEIPWVARRWHDVDTFWLAATPVTNAEYELFDPEHRRRRDSFSADDDSPATGVSWIEAQRYVTWQAQQTGLTLRLPGAVEWEYACHGGRSGRFPWGNGGGGWRYRSLANLGTDRAVAVGSFPTNGFGLHDMAGNVEEWSDDAFAVVGGKAIAGPSPEKVGLRVTKNCSAVFANPYYCGCEMVGAAPETSRSEHRGLRVAMSESSPR